MPHAERRGTPGDGRGDSARGARHGRAPRGSRARGRGAVGARSSALSRQPWPGRVRRLHPWLAGPLAAPGHAAGPAGPGLHHRSSPESRRGGACLRPLPSAGTSPAPTSTVLVGRRRRRDFGVGPYRPRALRARIARNTPPDSCFWWRVPNRRLASALVPRAGLPWPALARHAAVRQPRRRLWRGLAATSVQPGKRRARGRARRPVLAIPDQRRGSGHPAGGRGRPVGTQCGWDAGRPPGGAALRPEPVLDPECHLPVAEGPGGSLCAALPSSRAGGSPGTRQPTPRADGGSRGGLCELRLSGPSLFGSLRPADGPLAWGAPPATLAPDRPACMGDGPADCNARAGTLATLGNRYFWAARDGGGES